MKISQVSIGYTCYKIFGIRSLLFYSRIVSIATLKKIVGRVMLDVQYTSGLFKDIKFQGLFRGRSHNHVQGQFRNDNLEKFTNEKEFINPPSMWARIGRCNDNGESMFYCSNELLTAVIESRPTVNEFVTIAAFEGLYEGKSYEHKISPIGYRYLRELDSLSKMMSSMNPKNRLQFVKVDDFLDELFHMKIKKNAYYYKLSNAVAQCMLENIVNDEGIEMRQHGLIYSSILRNHKSFNVVLRPIYVNYYKIEFIQTFKVLELSELKVKLQLMRQGFLKGVKRNPADNFDIRWEDIHQDLNTIREYDLISAENIKNKAYNSVTH